MHDKHDTYLDKNKELFLTVYHTTRMTDAELHNTSAWGVFWRPAATTAAVPNRHNGERARQRGQRYPYAANRSCMERTECLEALTSGHLA